MTSEKNIVKAIETLGGRIEHLENDLYWAKHWCEEKDAEIEALKARIKELEEEKKDA